MLKGIVAGSIRHRGAVIALAAVVLCYGVHVARRVKLDVFPEFAPPRVDVQTEASGLSPEQVEELVTRPIEEALNGAGGLESIRSQSIQGLSVVTAVFRDGTDIHLARQIVAERLVEAASRMPQGVRAPTMAPLTSSASIVLSVGLTSARRTPMELRTFADWTLRPRLLGTPGVAKVVVYGGEVRELDVEVDQDLLALHGLGIDDVIAAARQATGVRGAGFIETGSQRIVVETAGQLLTPATLGSAVVAHRDGRSLRIADVARVAFAAEPKLGDASIGGAPGVILVLSSQLGANTLETTEAVERALADLAPACETEGIAVHPRLFRPASFIERSISNVERALLLGGVLVALVLFVFLYDLRTAFISITAIPLSLLAAVIVLERLGATLNTLTLGGLAIAIGEVVDDAIIDVENIHRRLRENHARGSPRSAARVVLDASLEVRGAVVYATFVVALVFLPVVTMSGIQGRLFAPLGWAYVLAVLASLVVALTLTPALACALLVPERLAGSEPRLLAALKARYERLLARALDRPAAVIGGAALLCAAAAATLPLFGGSFLPELREGHLIVHMNLVPGTSLAESMRLGREVSRELLANPRVLAVCQQAGRAESGDDTVGPHQNELQVALRPLSGEESEELELEVRTVLARFAGASFSVQSFFTERVEETISGVTAAVVVKVFGDDLDAIETKAHEVAQALSHVDGAADVQVESPPGSPEVAVRLRPERLALHGFRVVPVLEAVEAAFQGAVVAQTFEGNRATDVRVVLGPAARRDPEQVSKLVLTSPAGARVPLSELASVEPATGRYAVLHEATRRRQAVTCNVRGRDVASFVAEAKERVRARVAFPEGVYAVFGGEAETQAAARAEILVHSAIAGAGIVLLLSVVFASTRNLLLVLANLPFALVGGVVAVFCTGGWLSVGSLVGFVTLFGITTRNSIMMVSHFEHLVAREGVPWDRAAALRGASERLAPVLMTALVTALGLLPIALGTGEAGGEIEGPMAIVILGGLATSTALNLLVLPTLAVRFGRFAPRERFT